MSILATSPKDLLEEGDYKRKLQREAVASLIIADETLWVGLPNHQRHRSRNGIIGDLMVNNFAITVYPTNPELADQFSKAGLQYVPDLGNGAYKVDCTNEKQCAALCKVLLERRADRAIVALKSEMEAIKASEGFFGVSVPIRGTQEKVKKMFGELASKGSSKEV